MSSRQLRRLKKTQIDDEIEIENDNEFSDDFSPDEKGQINMFSMLDTEEIEEPDSDIEDENHDNQHDAEKKYTTDTLSDNDSRNDARPNLDKQDTNIKTKKKNKKKRTSKNITKKETSEKEIKLEKEVFNPVEIEIKYIDPEREINFLFKMNKYVPSNKLISEKLVNLPYQNTGIGMEIINESQNVTWLAFTHSSHFRKLEARLLDVFIYLNFYL